MKRLLIVLVAIMGAFQRLHAQPATPQAPTPVSSTQIEELLRDIRAILDEVRSNKAELDRLDAETRTLLTDEQAMKQMADNLENVYRGLYEDAPDIWKESIRGNLAGLLDAGIKAHELYRDALLVDSPMYALLDAEKRREEIAQERTRLERNSSAAYAKVLAGLIAAQIASTSVQRGVSQLSSQAQKIEFRLVTTEKMATAEATRQRNARVAAGRSSEASGGDRGGSHERAYTGGGEQRGGSAGSGGSSNGDGGSVQSRDRSTGEPKGPATDLGGSGMKFP